MNLQTLLNIGFVRELYGICQDGDLLVLANPTSGKRKKMRTFLVIKETPPFLSLSSHKISLLLYLGYLYCFSLL